MKFLAIVLKVAVSLGLLAYLAATVDVEASWRVMRTADATLVVAAVVLIALQIAIISERLRIILRSLGHQLRLTPTMRMTWEASFGSQVLPGLVGGDAIRVFRCYQSGISLSEGTGAVLADRLFGLFALLAIALTAALVVPVPASLHGWRSAPLIALALIGLGGVAVFGDRLTPWLPAWKPVQWARSVATHLRRVVSTGGGAVPAFALSLVGQVLSLISAYLLACGLRMNVSPGVVMLCVPWALLFASIPISLGGWGIRETSFVGLFGVFGVPQELALALSILFGVCFVLASLPGALLLTLPYKRAEPNRRALMRDATARRNGAGNRNRG